MAAIIITTAPRKPQPQESRDHGMAWKQQKPSLSRKSVWPKKQRLIKMESRRDSQKMTRFGKNEPVIYFNTLDKKQDMAR